MWKHYQIPGEDDDDEVSRPCGRFSLHAGHVLLGHPELDREMIREDGFYRVGEFQPVWGAYLRYQPAFVRYNELKLDQHLRLPAHKHVPELDAAEREIRALSLRLVAADGHDVPTQRLEVADFGRGPDDGGDCELEMFISDEAAYFRFFPPYPKT